MRFGAREIQILALQSVLAPTADDQMREIRRWFSKTFHTPYPQVEDMPDEEVLQHYFEDTFGNMEPKDLREMAETVLYTEEERKARKAKQEADMDKELEEDEAEVAKLPLVLPVAAPPQAAAAPDDGFTMKF